MRLIAENTVFSQILEANRFVMCISHYGVPFVSKFIGNGHLENTGDLWK